MGEFYGEYDDCFHWNPLKDHENPIQSTIENHQFVESGSLNHLRGFLPSICLAQQTTLKAKTLIEITILMASSMISNQ